jgi:hypothetical protein
VGDESMMEMWSDHFFPSVTFFGSIAPPQPQLQFTKTAMGPFGEVKIYSTCKGASQGNGDNGAYWTMIEMSGYLSTSGWSFVAFTATNMTDDPNKFQVFTTYTNSADRSNYIRLPNCLFNQETFFEAIEFNYPMLISPIMLIPEAVPAATLQSLYLKNMPEMATRIGPVSTTRERKLMAVGLSKEDFTPRSTLMAPPVLFQTRNQPTAECSFNYSSQYIIHQDNKAMRERCTYPYQCQAMEPEAIMSCGGGEKHAAKNMSKYFGLEPMVFQEKTGYADFLYSIADVEYVYRDGSFTETSSFIDSSTQTISLVLVRTFNLYAL